MQPQPLSGIPYKTAPPLPENSPSLYYNANNDCSPYGCREGGFRGNYGGPFNWPAQDPAQNACHPGYSVYSVEDFRDVPVYFADLMQHNFELEPLALVFSSAENAYRIHREIARRIYEQEHINIGKQDTAVLAMVMYRAFIGYRVRYKRNNIDEDITYLNSLVIENLTGRALWNLKSQIGYLRHVDRVAIPIPLPANVSNKGIDGKSAYDLGRYLP